MVDIKSSSEWTTFRRGRRQLQLIIVEPFREVIISALACSGATGNSAKTIIFQLLLFIVRRCLAAMTQQSGRRMAPISIVEAPPVGWLAARVDAFL